MTNGNQPYRLLILMTAFCLLSRTGVSQRAGNSKPTPERFDMRVREEFFAGLHGDSQAFERAMQLCESRLKANPKDPEALVWHGAGLSFEAGQAFEAGDREKGTALRQRGSAEMDEGVSLRPAIETLVPRGSALLGAAKRIPVPELRTAVLKKGIADFEQVVTLEKADFDQMCTHDRGEVLGGLAEGWYRLGDRTKSDQYLERMVRDLPYTRYAHAAKQSLENPAEAKDLHVTCLGCHTGQ